MGPGLGTAEAFEYDDEMAALCWRVPKTDSTKQVVLQQVP